MPPDFEAARRNMVDSQVRPNRVSDSRVLGAMRRLPRERFLPTALADRAYIDEDIALGGGRALIEPMVIARLMQLPRPLEGERGLVIGAGTGYGAAVLDACGVHVTALEEDRALLAIARPVLAALAPNVTIVEGPLTAGLSDSGAWDLIIIEGAIAAIPQTIAAQVKRPGGPADHGDLPPPRRARADRARRAERRWPACPARIRCQHADAAGVRAAGRVRILTFGESAA